MGVPTSEVGYTSATTGRGDHKVHTGLVVALERKKLQRRTKTSNTAAEDSNLATGVYLFMF
jgi:hypothetical protein